MLSKKQKKLPDVWRAQSLLGTPTFTSMADKRNFQLEKICKWVAKNNVPLSMVESSAFRDMLSAFDNTSSVFTSRSIRSKIVELDGAIRAMVVKQMTDSSISLTMDHWTSKNHQNFVGMTAHWIAKDFEMHSLPLGLFLHEGHSTGAHIFEQFLTDISRELNDKSIDVFAVTSDTTGNMNKFGEMLEAESVFHCYCSDHLLHLTANKCYSGKSHSVFHIWC